MKQVGTLHKAQAWMWGTWHMGMGNIGIRMHVACEVTVHAALGVHCEAGGHTAWAMSVGHNAQGTGVCRIEAVFGHMTRAPSKLF